MTDKSFGDHTNKNIVKNPLLSTAVTGLLLEDLTHNAVLLPVSLSQGVITRPGKCHSLFITHNREGDSSIMALGRAKQPSQFFQFSGTELSFSAVPTRILKTCSSALCSDISHGDVSKLILHKFLI